MAVADFNFEALLDASRRNLLSSLGERGQATATERAADHPVTRQAVSEH